MNMKTFLFILSMVCASVSGYKILVMGPIPIRSMNILGVGYVRNLLNAGHEVTYVSAFPLREPKQNFTHIDLSSTHLDLLTEDDAENIGWLMEHELGEDADIEYRQANCARVAEATFQNKEMLALLNDPTVKFDVVICDYIETEMYAALAAYYDCPMIWAYSLSSHWTTTRLVDEATNPAYAFDYISSGIPPYHSMAQRIKKLWIQIQWYYYKWLKTVPREKDFYEKFFGPLFLKKNKPLPNYYELMYNASFVLSNSFPGNGPMTSLPQNFKFIGGYHIETPTKPLSKELQSLLDNADDGFIYFSMGSHWKSKDIPKHVTQDLLNLFGALKQIVVWKYEENLPNLPKNVHILPWVPQQSVLAHPKCRFFITHGGHLSTTESAHFGVPTIGIPIYFDQFINVNVAVLSGRSIKVDLTLNIVKDLKIAIQKMIQDPSYTQRANEISQIYHDRPVPPGKELVHWVEHVVRTRGATHLRSPASLMPWWEKLYIDVIVLSFATIFLFAYLCKKYFSSKKVISIKKKIN